MRLPDLGVGLVHLPGLGPLLDELSAPPDVLEIEPQAFWSHDGSDSDYQVNPDRLEQAARSDHVLVHSVGYPIAGLNDGDPRQHAGLRETLACLEPPWWSEHASFVWTGSGRNHRHLGFLMPPIQTAESIGVVADRIKRLQDVFGLPFAFETGVNYLQSLPGELPDGAFWGQIADQADCGILLDLHNLWTNATNGRQPLDQAIAALPLERVWEVHLAGGQSHNGYWLDSHSGLPSRGLIEVAAKVVPTLPSLHAIIVEIIPDYIPVSGISPDGIAACLSTLRTIWESRASQTPCSRELASSVPGPSHSKLPSVKTWERWLANALAGHAEEPLKSDPGIGVYRDLIAMVRRGMIVETLPLSLRYLLKASGEIVIDRLFHDFWKRQPFRPFMSDEAHAFAKFAKRQVTLPHLAEVLDFELAGHQAALSGTTAVVWFSCEPEPLLRSLMLPSGTPEIRPCVVSVEVAPPRASLPGEAAGRQNVAAVGG